MISTRQESGEIQEMPNTATAKAIRDAANGKLIRAGKSREEIERAIWG